MVDYCLDLIEVLGKLEKCILHANDLKREFRMRVFKAVNRQALLVGAVLAGSLLIIYAISGSGILDKSGSKLIVFVRMFGAGFIVWTIGVALDLLFKNLWYKDYLPAGLTAKKKHYFAFYQSKKNELIEESKQKVNFNELRQSRFPAILLSVLAISTIANYFKNRRAQKIEDAISLYMNENARTLENQKISLIEKFEQVELADFLLNDDDLI